MFPQRRAVRVCLDDRAKATIGNLSKLPLVATAHTLDARKPPMAELRNLVTRFRLVAVKATGVAYMWIRRANREPRNRLAMNGGRKVRRRDSLARHAIFANVERRIRCLRALLLDAEATGGDICPVIKDGDKGTRC